MNKNADIKKLFVEFLSVQDCKDDEQTLALYGVDHSQFIQSNPGLVLFPRSTDQVVEIVKIAIEHHLALVPSGGRTGLSGGATAAKNEIVVSLEKMNEIKSMNLTSGVMCCEAGVITQTIQEVAKENGWFYPVNFASSGSSQIGGNVATNAGGVKVIRYGMTRNSIIGLKVVTGQGEVLHLNKELIKNNAGYDLRHLMIGSEGTLGIITEVSLALTQPPPSMIVALVALTSLHRVADLLELLSTKVTLYSFEFFSKNTQKYLSENDLELPFSEEILENSLFYVLVETPESELDVFQEVLSHAIQINVINEVVVAQSEAAAHKLWRFREDISESIAHLKPYKNDVSVTVDKLDEFVGAADDLFKEKFPEVGVLWYGHFGDGNVHINVVRQDLSKEDFVKLLPVLSEELYRLVAEFGGSISAEHGVGVLKRSFLHYTRSKEEIALMKQIKNIFDPVGVMNPGKLLL